MGDPDGIGTQRGRATNEGPPLRSFSPTLPISQPLNLPNVVLFVSDMHFGRRSEAVERAKEVALIDCLSAHAGDVQHLFLLGDVFDAYIEYEQLVPKGFVRFQALLARWTDRGVPVTYLAGNHDLWHRDYFRKELGVRVLPTRWIGRLCGRLAYLAHGDAPDTSDPLYQRLRPFLGYPPVATLYRRLLPAGGALAFARWFNRRFHDETVDPERVRALRRHARRVLRATSAEMVVMGHSHHAEQRRWPGGTYLNIGAWQGARTFASLSPGGTARLLRWNGTRAVSIEPLDALRPA